MIDQKEEVINCLTALCKSNRISVGETIALEKVIKELEQTRWIPCSERLPNNHECIKNNGLFNVSDGNRSYFGWFDIYDTKRFVKPTIAGFRVDNAVTAWMPLPQPYAEREVKE